MSNLKSLDNLELFFLDYRDRLELLEADLKAHVEKAGAWVEHKKLLVAWHYRLVEKDMKLTLMAKGRVIYFQLKP